MYSEIILTQGKVALVDSEDLEELTKVKWLFDRGYARRRVVVNGVQQCQHMHREVMKAPEGKSVDHINGDRLDNRKENLRIVSHRQNMFNMDAHRNATSKYKGVYWNKEKMKWTAQIAFQGKRRHIGHYQNEKEAAEAYNLKALELFGTYARLNKI